MKVPVTTLLVAFALALLGEPHRAAAEDERRYVKDLAAFFEEMDETYPFFDLKGIRKGWPAVKKRLGKKLRRCSSDEEFLDIVLEAISYLRDGHIGFVEMRGKYPETEPQYYPGIGFMPAAKNRVVVMSAAEKWAKVLKVGTVVTHIDGRQARAVLEKNSRRAWAEGGFFSSPQRARLFEYRIALRGKKGDKHKITYLDGKRKRTVVAISEIQAKGWPHTYNMPKDLVRHGRSCRYGKLPSGVGYIYLRRIDRNTEEGIAAAFSSDADTKAWILDLRGNGGGGYNRGLVEKIAAVGRPLAVLIDAGCISAGETLARDCVRNANARLFGSTTAGSSSAKRRWAFPSRIATLSVPTRSRSGLGRGIEYFGIQPHEKVEADPKEVERELNSCVLRAEEFLLEKSKRS